MIIIPDDKYDRRQYLGGSNVAAALGLSQYATPYDVYRAKTSAIPEEMDPEKKLFLERRKRWEPVVVQMLREEFEAEIVAVNVRYQDPEVPFFAAEIDFEWRDTDGTVQNGEVKTVSPFAYGPKYGWGEPGSGDIPMEYECQVIHGLGVTGRNKVAVAVMVGLDEMRFYEVRRNEELLADVRERLKRFWADHVVALVPPEPKTLKDVEKLYQMAPGRRILAPTAGVAAAALRLRALRSQIEAFQFQADAIEFALKKEMGEAESLYVDGRKIVTWKEQNYSHLDSAALKAAYPSIYRSFLKKGRRRVLKTLKTAAMSDDVGPTIDLPEVPALPQLPEEVQ